ncbi:hypothetical protein HDV57DRAFT_488379 [Trichoderma longibrachiatum]
MVMLVRWWAGCCLRCRLWSAYGGVRSVRLGGDFLSQRLLSEALMDVCTASSQLKDDRERRECSSYGVCCSCVRNSRMKQTDNLLVR